MSAVKNMRWTVWCAALATVGFHTGFSDISNNLAIAQLNLNLESPSRGQSPPSNSADGGDQDNRGQSGWSAADGSNLQDNDLELITSFTQKNCVTCHSARNAKGEVDLTPLTSDAGFESELWDSVLSVLEEASMPPASSPQPDPDLKARVIEFIRAGLGARSKKGYLQQAQIAFKRGETGRAAKLFYAHAITASEDEAAEVLDHFKFYRPRVAKPEELVAANNFARTIKPGLVTELKFAVGIDLNAAPQVTNVEPIGFGQRGNFGGGASGFGDPRGGGGGGNSNSQLETFEDLTGDFGRALVDAFSSRQKEGKYGTLLAALNKAKPKGDNAPNRDGLGGAGGFSPPDGFGQGGGLGGGAASESGKTDAGQPLTDGLVYVGKGSTSELLKKAVEAGADGLFIFDIKATKNRRSNKVHNDTRVRFMLITGRVVATTPKSLSNVEVERARQQDKGGEEVQEQMNKLFHPIDQLVVLDPLPSMSQAAALKYIHGQLHSESEVDPLRLMAQARLFQSKGIITSDQLATIYQIVLEGNEGISLATGSADDRRLVLELAMPDL